MTLGPIDFFPYRAAPDFVEHAMEMWNRCKEAPADGGASGPGTSTDPSAPPTTDPNAPPSTDPGDGSAEPGPPTYLELVTQRLLDEGYIRKNDQPNPHQAKRAARQCVRAEHAARAAHVIGKDEHPCLNEPVFFPGSEAGWAAVRDAMAIAEHPEWVRLTYLSSNDKEPVVKRQWYATKGYKTYAAGHCAPKPRPRGVECDEYPFYSTLEGGPGASLQEVPRAQNQKEGHALNSMYEDASCRMASGMTTYFVVPMATPKADADGAPPMFGDPTATFGGPPSMHACPPPPVAS